MDFTIPEEYMDLKARARKFVDEECIPVESEVDKMDEIPEEMFNHLRAKSMEMGVFAPFAPKEYGGGGMDTHLAEMMFWEEVGRTSFALQQFIVGNDTGWDLPHATEYQKERFFIPTIKGEKIGGFGAMAEPQGCSDMRNYKTIAVRKGDNWIINGTKWLITAAEKADWGRVWAVTDPEKGRLDIFLVEKGTPGFEIVRPPAYMGTRGIGHCRLHFRDCVVPEANRMQTMKYGNPASYRYPRLRRAAQGLGSAQRCYEMGLDYSKKRVTFGKPLATRQFVQFSLVRSAMEIESTRLMIYRTAWKADQGENIDAEEAMCKILGTELGHRVADRVMMIYGGLGVSRDLPIERIFRDQQVARIYAGSNPVLTVFIARHILGHKFVRWSGDYFEEEIPEERAEKVSEVFG